MIAVWGGGGAFLMLSNVLLNKGEGVVSPFHGRDVFGFWGSKTRFWWLSSLDEHF